MILTLTPAMSQAASFHTWVRFVEHRWGREGGREGREGGREGYNIQRGASWRLAPAAVATQNTCKLAQDDDEQSWRLAPAAVARKNTCKLLQHCTHVTYFTTLHTRHVFYNTNA